MKRKRRQSRRKVNKPQVRVNHSKKIVNGRRVGSW